MYIYIFSRTTTIPKRIWARCTDTAVDNTDDNMDHRDGSDPQDRPINFNPNLSLQATPKPNPKRTSYLSRILASIATLPSPLLTLLAHMCTFVILSPIVLILISLYSTGDPLSHTINQLLPAFIGACVCLYIYHKRQQIKLWVLDHLRQKRREEEKETALQLMAALKIQREKEIAEEIETRRLEALQRQAQYLREQEEKREIEQTARLLLDDDGLWEDHLSDLELSDDMMVPPPTSLLDILQSDSDSNSDGGGSDSSFEGGSVERVKVVTRKGLLKRAAALEEERARLEEKERLVEQEKEMALRALAEKVSILYIHIYTYMYYV